MTQQDPGYDFFLLFPPSCTHQDPGHEELQLWKRRRAVLYCLRLERPRPLPHCCLRIGTRRVQGLAAWSPNMAPKTHYCRKPSDLPVRLTTTAKMAAQPERAGAGQCESRADSTWCYLSLLLRRLDRLMKDPLNCKVPGKSSSPK